MKTHFLPARGKIMAGIALGLAALAPASRGQLSYTTILAANYSVTGVRGTTGGEVVLTGSYQNAGATMPLLYQGPLTPTNPGGYSYLVPTFIGQNVTTGIFYGPDTASFNPGLGVGNIRAVGSYQYSGSSVLNHGMIYQGAITGGGAWTQIDVPSVAVGGATVENTIPHSTMGTLVVGDYDLQGVPDSGNAFIYNITTLSWTIMDIGGTSNDTTAYGIWQNGIGGTSYTIAGGTKDGFGPNKGFLVNYDSDTEDFTDLTYYSYSGPTGAITHFEGITGTATGFNLIATTDTGAAFASVPVHLDGSFGDATWHDILFPGSNTTTGNSAFENYGMGIYIEDGTPGVQSYVVVVPEPAAAGVLAAGLAIGAVLAARRGKKVG